MAGVLQPPTATKALPTHLDLPETDGAIVENSLELPQSILLTGSIWPVLQKLHPDNQFAVLADSGIYWKLTDPPLDGCRSPDWYYVPNVPPELEGEYRRSYVLWQEHVPPLIIIEYVSGDGREERDRTPEKGKFWVYEQAIKAPYYAIYEVDQARVEVYRLIGGRYVPMEPNTRGHFEVSEMGIELGLWHGSYLNHTVPWLRFFDLQGRMLPSAEERAEAEGQHAKAEKERADKERKHAEKERKRAEQEQQRADEERDRAEAERGRAEAERERAERLAGQLRSLGLDPEA